MYRIYLNFAKSYILSYRYFSKFYNKKNFAMPFLKFKHLKLKFRVFLAGHSVAMVTCVTKIILPCSTVIGQFFDTMIVASIIDKDLRAVIMTHQNLSLRMC